jgi:threonine synthase
MKFLSTRGKSPQVSLRDALLRGLAPDGGLYVPAFLPKLDFAEDPDLKADSTRSKFARAILAPFFDEEPDLLEKLESICQDALNFPTPIRRLDSKTSVLELFHGPTLAFKDVGARFLAHTFNYMNSDRSGQKLTKTVIVATSGDTGSAVASAFHKREGFQVVILFPKGRITARQEKQLTFWRDNVQSFAVHGDFDACQKLAKDAIADFELQSKHSFISANSISLGRLLPQMIYHARASVEYASQTGARPNLFIPSGNLGNGVAAMWAKSLGAPIGKVVLATNANRSLTNFLVTKEWKPFATVPTLANAMDVGAPSNIERLRSLFPNHNQLIENVDSESVSDAEISEVIKQQTYGEVWCPHSATAVHVRNLEKFKELDAIICATAHPAKFESVVEPLIGKTIAVPGSLGQVLDHGNQAVDLEPSLAAFRAVIRDDR